MKTRYFCALVGSTLILLGGCAQGVGGRSDGLNAPGVNRFANGENGVEVGHRLIAAGQYELALRAFHRAAIDRAETDAEILLGIGTANIGLGRLGQAEEALRLAVEKESAWPELYNNLGVLLVETKQFTEAAQILRKAYALDNGNSDAIRDNLRLALSKLDNTSYEDPNNNEFKLVRRGTSEYLIRRTP